MSSGKNMHNAFRVVLDTFESVDKLIKFCNNDVVKKKYHLPTKRFLRYSSDVDYEGWVYWSFIVLFQRIEDGSPNENMWINAPVYAMEINLDPDTCDEPELIIAKLEYNNINEWGKGCPYHYVFYNPIHQIGYFDLVTNDEEGYDEIIPVKGQEEYIYNQYLSLRRVVRKKYLLTEITDKNAYEKIFGTIEELAKC
jgi:hypothetical protein